MPPRSKKEMSQSEKEQVLADMVVKAAANFAYLGLTVDDIGIPPLTADKKECSGHSWKNFCMTCRFNNCWMCGDIIDSYRNGGAITCWKGVCGSYHAQGTIPSVEHHGRVMELVKAMTGRNAAPAPSVGRIRRADEDPIVIDSDDEALGGGGWVGDRRIGDLRPVPRIQLAKAPLARKAQRVKPAPKRVAPPVADPQAIARPVADPQAIADPAIVPQINIAIAPLAQVRVEGVPQTDVARIADGAMGNARFEVKVTIVLEQVVGQQ